jgi:hypothetical protein
METIGAEKICKWVEESAAALGLAENEQQQIRCQLELSCFWLPQTPVCSFGFELTLQCIAGYTVPVELVIQKYGESAAPPLRICLNRPLRLDPVFIAKPWGQEIWYTGVEQRGVCGFRASEAGSVPLPWLLETLSHWLTGDRRELVLLKILDPLADEVWGDLYFELHQEKREVYVVSHVDTGAWPDGVGAIRFGFDSQRLAAYGSDEEFKIAFRASVAVYEAIRREVDQALDERRVQSGVAMDAPVAPEQIQRWQQQLPSGLLEQERHLRQQMEAFSSLRPLRVGDVVKVPCYTPHALQHGVRTVEFQTPVYERKILSFAQKVLTQDHWDTEEAVALMALEPEPDQPFSNCYQRDGVVIETIVDFADFEVQRWRLEPDCSHDLSVAGSYALVMVVEGEVIVGECLLQPEQACLIPGLMGSARLQQSGALVATVLVAYPA